MCFALFRAVGLVLILLPRLSSGERFLVYVAFLTLCGLRTALNPSKLSRAPESCRVCGLSLSILTAFEMKSEHFIYLLIFCCVMLVTIEYISF